MRSAIAALCGVVLGACITEIFIWTRNKRRINKLSKPIKFEERYK